jgi:predicted RNase H-like nuclease
VPVVLGVDGWRGGWIGALVGPDGSVQWRVLADAAAVLGVDAAVTAIDIPMGLPESGSRGCDLAARAELGRAGSSVFAAPIRPVLGCSTYPAARAVLRELGGSSMSAQAFGIVRKVRDVDDLLTPTLQHRVVEVHPELSFRRLGGVATMPGKRTAAGVGVRLAVLRGWLSSVAAALAEVPPPVPVDDALDALVCAWTAQRVVAGEFDRLGDGARDSRGLLMQIVAPHPPTTCQRHSGL